MDRTELHTVKCCYRHDCQPEGLRYGVQTNLLRQSYLRNQIGNKTTTEDNGRYEIQHATNSRLRLYDITQGSHEGVYYVFTFREINVSPHYSAILELSEFGADSISVSRGGKAMGIIRIQRN